ncbi:Cyclic di-GMP phosphodiesterase response regulator RpfG [Paenibacillus konkukensis]|uniref:Cyclic di-GMP phosphodiesterase response regulator RpfG n=1 Tax=Paenibacillus konkukensis TaxID=2020716 RepID=A0ABY4RWC7_9BACL|nr:HD domain-containing phosphohydrolase [Paenibacillus konkukensis]UQZ86685.1 Cyclic di-GMP phosphodiesterase response regulator RpfG [Paenibacillus konkukensis]
METAFDFYLKLADGVIITDREHRIVEVNSKYEEMTGYTRAYMIGLRASFLRSRLTPRKTYESMYQSLQMNLAWSGVFINRKKNKDIWHTNITITPILHKQETYYIGVVRDLDQIPQGSYLSETRKLKLQSEILKVLAISCEIRDPHIEEHLTRVQQGTEKLLIAHNERLKLGLSEEYIQQVVNASIMHDIGKSGIPEGILYKPGKLNYYERHIMETHPLIGLEIVGKISRELEDDILQEELKIAEHIIHYHHEKWDGSGYPAGLKGDEIPFEAQVVSIIDVYDALTSRRAYKDAWQHEEAVRFLLEQKGAAFNPELVDTFLSMGEQL